MGAKVVIISTAVATFCVGLLVGGLIGHFASKAAADSSNISSDDSANHEANNNKPNPVQDRINSQILFDAISAASIRKVIKLYSSQPHLAGSERNNELADIIETTWKEFGFETKRDIFNVLLSYPGGPTRRNQAFIWSGNSVEVQTQKEETELVPNADADKIVPPFNAYAKAGDVKRNKAFYVNYCRAEDFVYITGDHGLNLTDSIVICRYGKIFRGNKVRLAQDYGAAAVILYNDPQDSVIGVNATYNETFPNSWYLPPSGVERGSTSISKGDPLTPGFPAKEYAIRMTVEQARKEKMIPGIPTQPVSYEEIKPFFEALSGEEVDLDTWKGGLDKITYRFGGVLQAGKEFQIKNYNTDERRNITNVFGIIRGKVDPDRYILFGNHRDAWMNGAVDPTSGTGVMMESAKAFSALLKTGWRPRRTLIFCSWDAEEYGIIGSIEWLDEVRVLIADRALTYLNCDAGVMGTETLVASASPLLWKLIYDTSKLVNAPGGKSLYQQWLDVTGNKTDPESKPLIGDLGSGSDHTGFFHMHGVTSMESYYLYDKSKTKLATWYPLYHTSYETFQAVEDFLDPDFLYHKSIATFFTEITRNLSDSVIVPFVVTDYAVRLRHVYEELNSAVRPKLLLKNQSLAESLDYLSHSIDKFAAEAIKFDEKVASIFDRDPSWLDIRTVNDQLLNLERAFLYPLGILDRKYIKHVVFAPAANNLYGSSAFPGIHDSLYEIDTSDEPAWDKVKDELTKAVYSVESATKAITVDIIV
ncbi:putative N-acetylated-alpha-linked acidic dipeptidase [Watersipora subatra]|uniref:putative N-acetylated-alpha-linked acidic dipeptidase n=1 Tax=Watersipora subatra TaxID=2589382 RepID=UPI00355C7421